MFQPSCEDRADWVAEEYKPLLDEIEKIQAEAGIEAADVQRRTGPGASGVGAESRNRR